MYSVQMAAQTGRLWCREILEGYGSWPIMLCRCRWCVLLLLLSFVDGIVVTPSLHLSNLMQNWVCFCICSCFPVWTWVHICSDLFSPFSPLSLPPSPCTSALCLKFYFFPTCNHVSGYLSHFFLNVKFSKLVSLVFLGGDYRVCIHMRYCYMYICDLL